MKTILILILIFVVARIAWRLFRRRGTDTNKPAKPLKQPGPMQRKLYTVWVFFVVNIRRLFRV